jgi:hypothetical protein
VSGRHTVDRIENRGAPWSREELLLLNLPGRAEWVLPRWALECVTRERPASMSTSSACAVPAPTPMAAKPSAPLIAAVTATSTSTSVPSALEAQEAPEAPAALEAEAEVSVHDAEQFGKFLFVHRVRSFICSLAT